MRPIAMTWLPRRLYATCIDEACRWYPLETGGVFMGYWHNPQVVVITQTIGPGPNALHGKHYFEPEQEWQLSEIAKHYEQSGRRETYIGDWHSHPRIGAGNLSARDRRVLRRIINTPAARAQMPLMAIFHGDPKDWQLAVWRAQLRYRRFLWPKLVVDNLNVRLF